MDSTDVTLQQTLLAPPVSLSVARLSESSTPTSSLLKRAITPFTDTIAYLSERTALDRNYAQQKQKVIKQPGETFISLDSSEPFMRATKKSFAKKPKSRTENRYSTANRLGTPILEDNTNITLSKSTLEGRALRLALRTQLLAQNTEIVSDTNTSTWGGTIQEFVKKAPETLVHSLAEVSSALTTTPILLAAAGLDSLVGTFTDVQQTYYNSLVEFNGNRCAALTVAGLHFVAWAMKFASVLVAAGLTVIVNAALFMVDKLISGSIALVVNSVAFGVRFVARNPKTVAAFVTSGALIAGIVLTLKALIGTAAGAAVGAGIVATLPYIGMAIGGLLGLYLVVRGVRFSYDHMPSLKKAFAAHDFYRDMKGLEDKIKDKVALDLAVNQNAANATKGLIQTRKQDEILKDFYGSDEAKKYLGPVANSTAARVISHYISDYARAFGLDIKRTMTGIWNTALNDLTITQRALTHMTEDQLKSAVADYKVAKGIAGQDALAVKAALFASLQAQQRIARGESADLANDRMIVHIFQGSDAEILKAVNTYTDRTGTTGMLLSNSFRKTPTISNLFSDMITTILAQVEIEALLNEVKVKREIEDTRKNLEGAVAALRDRFSGFANYVARNAPHIQVTKNIKIGELVATSTAQPNVGFFHKKGTKVTIETLRFVRVEYSPTITREDVLKNTIAVELADLYKEYKQFSRLKKLASYRSGNPIDNQIAKLVQGPTLFERIKYAAGDSFKFVAYPFRMAGKGAYYGTGSLVGFGYNFVTAIGRHTFNLGSAVVRGGSTVIGVIAGGAFALLPIFKRRKPTNARFEVPNFAVDYTEPLSNPSLEAQAKTMSRKSGSAIENARQFVLELEEVGNEENDDNEEPGGLETDNLLAADTYYDLNYAEDPTEDDLSLTLNRD